MTRPNKIARGQVPNLPPGSAPLDHTAIDNIDKGARSLCPCLSLPGFPIPRRQEEVKHDSWKTPSNWSLEVSSRWWPLA